MDDAMSDGLGDSGGSRAGAALLVIGGAVSLVVGVWHSIQGGNGLEGKDLAALMVASGIWAPMHQLGSFGYALLAAGALAALSAPGGFGRSAMLRAGLALLSVGSLAGMIGYVFDGQRAYLAPAVVQGQDPSVFVALTYLWDDRGIGVGTHVLIGVGVALLAASQLVTKAVSAKWASALGIVGGLVIAISFLLTFGLRIFPFGVRQGGGIGPNALIGILGFVFIYGWLILAGAATLKKASLVGPAR